MGFDTGKTPLCKVRDMIFGLEQTEFLALAAAYLVSVAVVPTVESQEVV